MKSDCQMHEHYIRLLCHAGRLQWAIAKPETCPCATACAATNGSAGLKFFLSVGMGVWGYGQAGRRPGDGRRAGGGPQLLCILCLCDSPNPRLI